MYYFSSLLVLRSRQKVYYMTFLNEKSQRIGSKIFHRFREYIFSVCVYLYVCVYMLEVAISIRLEIRTQVDILNIKVQFEDGIKKSLKFALRN